MPRPLSSDYLRYLRLSSSVVLVCGLIGGVLWFVAGPPDLARASRQAHELERVVRADPRFTEARVEPYTNGQLVVFAPQALPLSARADLEHLVAARGSRSITVSYLAPVPSSP